MRLKPSHRVIGWTIGRTILSATRWQRSLARFCLPRTTGWIRNSWLMRWSQSFLRILASFGMLCRKPRKSWLEPFNVSCGMPASIVSSICEDKCRSRRIQLRDLNAEAKLKDGDDLTAVQDFYVAEMTNKQGQWRRP